MGCIIFCLVLESCIRSLESVSRLGGREALASGTGRHKRCRRQRRARLDNLYRNIDERRLLTGGWGPQILPFGGISAAPDCSHSRSLKFGKHSRRIKKVYVLMLYSDAAFRTPDMRFESEQGNIAKLGKVSRLSINAFVTR